MKQHHIVATLWVFSGMVKVLSFSTMMLSFVEFPLRRSKHHHAPRILSDPKPVPNKLTQQQQLQAHQAARRNLCRFWN